MNTNILKQNPNIKLFILYGMIFELSLRLYQPFQIKFLERIGGNDFSISLFNSLPGLIMVFTVLPGIFIMRNFNSKKVTSLMLILSRIFILSFALIPMLPSRLQPIVFLIIAALMSAPLSIYTNGFQSLTGELFRSEERAHALGLKDKYSVLINMLVTFATGQLLSLLPRTNEERMLIYQLFFILAFVLTFKEIKIIKKLKPVHHTTNSSKPFNEVIREIFKNKQFLLFITCSLIFHFGWQMGWPLFSIYTIKNLGADEGWLAIISIGSMTTMFVGYSLWPKLITKYGNPRIIAVCTVGMSLTPLFYIVSKDLYTLTIMASLTGIFTSGTLTVLLSSVLEVIPSKNRIIYMGVYATFTNITLSIAPIVGHYFSSSVNIQFALLMSTLFRLLGGITFILRNRYLSKHGLD